MAYNTGNESSAGPIIFVGAIVVACLGAGWYYTQARDGATNWSTSVEETDEKGRIICSACRGEGRSRCSTCNGHGRVNYIMQGRIDYCHGCGGSKKTHCMKCQGVGKVKPSPSIR